MASFDKYELCKSPSLTRLGDFWKNFKQSQNLCWLFGLKRKASFFSKNYPGSFLGNFWKNLGATFYFNIWSHWTHPFREDERHDEGGRCHEEGSPVAEDVEGEGAMVAGVKDNDQSSVE